LQQGVVLEDGRAHDMATALRAGSAAMRPPFWTQAKRR